MLRLGLVGPVFFVLSVIPGIAVGQLSDGDRSRLAAQIESAAKNLDPSRFPDLAVSQSQVLDLAEQVQQYLSANTTPENRKAWLEYLELAPLVEAIESGTSLGDVARESVDLRYRLIGTAPGLELEAMRNLRDAVEQLIEAIRFRDKEASQRVLARQLESLAERLREFDDNPSADDFAALSALTSLLATSGQGEDVLHSLRATFRHPNLAILVGQPMVQTVVNRSVHQTRPVRDCILGTRIVGNATLTGAVNAELIPTVGRVRLNVTLAGNVYSRNVGYNGPVRLRTVGQGEINVSRVLAFDESGVSLGPIASRATLRTEILCIEHRLALVRKIARKKAAQQKPQAERIATAKMRRQVSSQFASEIDGAAVASPGDVLGEIRPLLGRLSLEEPVRFWNSTRRAIIIDSNFRRGDQLSSIVARPAISEPFDAAIQIHESLINNALTPVLAGRTFKESQLNELLKEAGRPLPSPEGGDNDETEPPFEIDFARLRPIIFEARHQTLRIGVRGTRFKQGNRELKQALEITADYEPAENADGVAVLQRTGEVDVDFPGRSRLTVSQAGMKPAIRKKFSDVFPQTVLDRPLEVPMDVKLKAIRGRVFRPRTIEAEDGWLTITVR